MSMSAYNRDVSRRKALRKRRIDRATRWSGANDLYDNLHQYSKNTIHCSCPDCSTKTRNKGRRRYRKGNYNRALNYKHSELRKLENADYE